jgi:hypothetical protein
MSKPRSRKQVSTHLIHLSSPGTCWHQHMRRRSTIMPSCQCKHLCMSLLMRLIMKLQRQRRRTSGDDTSPANENKMASELSDNDKGSTTDSDVPELLISAFNQLLKTRQHPLFTNKPLGSHISPPHFHTMSISPVKWHGDLLQVQPQSDNEQLLQAVLHDAEVREAELKGEICGQQAALILQNVYCDKLRKEIYGQEEKRKKQPGNTALKIKDIRKAGSSLTLVGPQS